VRTEKDSSLATQLKEVQQERDGLKRELADLTKEVRELQKDRQSSNNELTTLREELQERKRTEDRLQEQLDHHSMTCPHTAEEPTSTSQASPALPAASLPPSPQNSLPLTAAPAQTSNTPAPTPTSPNSTPSSPEETLAEIVLLMDSNGKFVQENKRFPRHKTRKVSPRQHPGPAPWTPQPRPQQHQPQCPPHPAQHRPPQPSFRPTQTRPNTHPPHPPTADPHLEEPQPGRQSYAQAVRRATGPAPTNEMSDIKQMLNLLCSHVIGRGS
ncbi:unnamed protein product, partial [Coregonus sp. 'balchen']